MNSEKTIFHILIKRNVWIQWGILFGITILVYHNVFFMKFQLEWDDQWQVVNHMTSNGFSLSNLQYIFCDIVGNQYSPINQLYYTLLYAIDGYNPTIFHAGSLFFHLLNVFAVYLLAAFVLQYSPQKTPLTSWFAFLASLLFAIQPVQVESVCWISASKVVLSTFFYLASLLLYIGYKQKGKYKLFAASVFCSLLSVGCKEQAVTLCVCLLLIDAFLLKCNMRRIQVYAEKLWFIMPAVAFSLVSIIANLGAGEDTVGYTLVERIIFFCYSLFRYLLQSTLPFKLSYLYPFPFQVGAAIPASLYIYPLIIIFITYLVFKIRKEQVVVFCTFFFLLNLLPMLHLIPLPRYFITADRYLYLPYATFAIGLVWYANVFYARIQPFFRPCAFLYIGYLVCYSLWYIPLWKDSETLKQNFRHILKQREKIIRPQDFDLSLVKTIAVKHVKGNNYIVSYKGYQDKVTKIPFKVIEMNDRCYIEEQ